MWLQQKELKEEEEELNDFTAHWPTHNLLNLLTAFVMENKRILS